MTEVQGSEQRSGWDVRRTLRLAEYERAALELFAARGFREVTIDDVAEAAGVSARTLFRYFPTKEDFLLGMPRRGTVRLAARIAQLAPSDTPEQAVWDLILEGLATDPPDAKVMNLWRAAAAGAPEVVARVTGERVELLFTTLADYFARSLGVDLAVDPLPRVMAGGMVGVEHALLQSLGRSTADLPEIIAAASRALHVRRP
ncbi:MAG: TetR family transcriptional regulator [Actinomycetota bacterium]|nr:TetR family transcriptional regulator [Actinomycetota bacterium]